ncbi:3'-5' exoribonuclease YhaM family protein [Rhodopirellula sp. MGV]|uniref:3'-5' exoribonuclease YhaM family protein n=1 Tax=Rhodopirellula sp. MGV TaxID=2023130 RepID=UPI000B974AAE|nr:HD domain-containing protein [Rhodopirellula sp. MGV]OYP35767.1 CMP-binding protein [Rhodopirellula sp. MGV]PNY33650.1 HD domain-containing protein [Rhodopirellula baltica]
MTRTPINELTDGFAIDQPFRLADKQLRVNRQGGKYLLLKLADRTGSIIAMMWNVEDSDYEDLERGGYIHGRGRTQVHQGALQVILTDIESLDEQEVDLQDFEQFDAAASDTAIDELRQLIDGMSNVYLRGLGQSWLADDAFVARLKVATAAVSNHHAYPGGLLRHTVDLMQLCQFVGPRYPRLDVELLMFGAFLHDLGKIEEISASGELTYTDRGQLVGHIVIGIQMLDAAVKQYESDSGNEFPVDLKIQLEHLIVSHHGQLEYGSPRLPSTLEAITLHHLDNMDAKITSFTSLIESDLTNSENWTSYHPSIGRKLWKKQ